MPYTRTFDLGTLTADADHEYHDITGADLTGADSIWIIGTVAWAGDGGTFTFDTELSSTLGGLIGRSPLLQESHNLTVHISVLGDLRGVADDLQLRVFNIPSGATLTLDIAAVASYS